MGDIHICFATDDGYAPYCAVAIQSIRMNAAESDRLFFYVLHAGLAREHIEMLEKAAGQPLADSFEKEGSAEQSGAAGKAGAADRDGAASDHRSNMTMIQLDPADYQDVPLIPGRHFSHIETYFRFAIARVIPSAKKVLYLDCDILVRKSLSSIYHTNLQGKAIGMVSDNALNPNTDKPKEFNAGIMMIDCERWRNEDIESRLRQYAAANKEQIQIVDQEVINNVLRGDIYELEERCNKQIRMEIETKETLQDIMSDESLIILHYVTPAKPWHGIYQNKLTDEYASYMKRTPIPRPVQGQDVWEQRQGAKPEQYYDALLCLRYLLGINVIHRHVNLFIACEGEINQEFVLAAGDVGFAHIHPILYDDIDEHLTHRHSPDLLSGDGTLRDFVLIDSYDYARISKEMHERGYVYGKDYALRCSDEQACIEKELIRRRIGSGTKVIVYGTAVWAEKCTAVLDRMGAEILFYLDSDKAKEGQEILGKTIFCPNQSLLRDTNYDKIIVASSAHQEISERLISEGIPGEDVVCFEKVML